MTTIDVYFNTPPPDGLRPPLRQLYEISFVPEERDDFEVFFRAPAAGQGMLYTLAGADGALTGFAYCLLLPGIRCAYLGYLAVQPGSRNAGLGGLLLDYLTRDCAGRGLEGLFFDVQSPQAAEGEARALRQRRINFYQRHGAEVIADGGAFRIPSMTGQGSLPARLVWLPTHPGIRPPFDGHPAATFTYIYRHAYHLPADFPLLQAILQELP